MTEAIIFGTGNWLERTLQGMRVSGIKPAFVVGRRPLEEGKQRLLSLGIQDAQYVQPDQLLESVAKASLADNVVAIVISKPIDHQPDAILASELPVVGAYVEKPFNRTLHGALEVVQRFSEVPGQLVGGDHYLNGKTVPLAWLQGLRYIPPEQIASVDNTPVSELLGALNRIGSFTAINASIVEGGLDSHGGVEGREWLEDPMQGGVIADLGSHLMAIGERMGIWKENPPLKKVHVEEYDAQRAQWRTMRRHHALSQAERFARLDYTGVDGIPVTITVGKIGRRTDIPVGKSMTIKGTEGTAYVDLANNQVDVRLYNNQNFGVKLVGQPYEVIWDNFLKSIRGRAPNSIQEVVKAIAMTESVTQVLRNQPISEEQADLRNIFSLLPSLQRHPLSVGA